MEAVIVNYDSKQLYKDLRIISARPSMEEENLAPHHLFGFADATEVCSAGSWLLMAKEIINSVQAPIIFVGGTGMYLSALMNGIAYMPPVLDEIKTQVRQMSDAEIAEQLGADADINPRRNTRALEVLLATGKPIKFWHQNQAPHDYHEDDFLTLFMNVSRETLYERINLRFGKMLEAGAIDEVKKVMEMALDKELPIMKAIGVPEIIAYLKGEITLDEATAKSCQFSRNYAKRQVTWMSNQIKNKIEVQEMKPQDVYELVKQNIRL